ncbi:MAG: thiamine phosphate synthase [Acidimicrobiia bacterium]
MAIGRLHLITDTRGGRDPMPVVAAALAAGVPVVQVRAKGATDRQYYDLACRVVDQCARHGALCLVDDRLDVALTAGAGGVHLGEDDLPVAAARHVLDGRGGGFEVGATARGPAAAQAHEAAGATYLGVGPVYATSAKDGLPAPLGLARLRDVASAVGIPVIAIAGVTAERVPELVQAGAHGVAVIGAVSEAADPYAATATLMAAIDLASRSCRRP